MRAVIVRAFGGPERLGIEEVRDPVPESSQVVVRVHAIGVNPYDTYVLSGTHALRPALPYTPGADAAGVIEQVGADAAGLKVGDRVYVGGTVVHDSQGAYAQKVVCRVDQVHALPPHVSFAQGAAVNVPYVTAWYALHDRARLQAGETLFVHGASGGVGLAAIQIATALGARVIGTAGTPAGAALVEAQGAVALNHHDDDYLARLDELTDGRGPDVILESLANVNLNRDLAAAAAGGRVVIVGNRGTVEIDPRRAMSRMLTVHAFTMWRIASADLRRIHAGLAAGLAKGVLSPVVGHEMGLAEAAAAHRLILQPGARGKIVLNPH
jgi:NADPH2:quinone reductase